MVIEVKTRKIGTKFWSVAGKFYSRKMQRVVYTESLLEMKYCLLFELCPMVIEYIEQPITIKINGKKYTPDFQLILNSEKINLSHEVFLEIKPSKFLKKALFKIQNISEEIKKFYPDFINHIFILTEKDISEAIIELLKNRYYRSLNSEKYYNYLSECPFKLTNHETKCPLKNNDIVRCKSDSNQSWNDFKITR